VKSIIPCFWTANRNSVIWAANEVRLSLGDDDDVWFSAVNNDDQVVRFSEDGSNNKDIGFSVGGGDDDQDAGFSVGGCVNDKDVEFSVGGDDDDDDQDVMPMSVVGRAPVVGPTAGRVLHRCVTFTVTVAAATTVIIVSKHDIAQ